jgi:peptide/nickel transport system substrate-binding protein
MACGGDDSGSQLVKSDNAREPGAVWFSRDNWMLEDETKQAVRGGIYRDVTSDAQTEHFDPIVLASSESPYASTVFEHLMGRPRSPGLDPRSIEAQSAIPQLASAWEFADDGRTIVFTLRQGVKFHNHTPVNGRVMDIDDWRTTDERFRATGQYRSLMPSVFGKSEFPDSKTMVWKGTEPYAGIQQLIFNNQWTYAVLPKELNANTDIARQWPIGTGFRMLDKFQPSIGYEYKKHPEYWAGDPFIDRWHIPIIPEYANRYAQFVAGNIIDFAPTARDVLRVAKDVPGAVIVANEINEEATRWMQWGPLDPNGFASKDPRVRQAMRQSINFKAIAEVVSAKKELEAAGIPIEMAPSTHVNKHPAFWLNPEEGELRDRSIIFTYDPADAKKRINCRRPDAGADAVLHARRRGSRRQ